MALLGMKEGNILNAGPSLEVFTVGSKLGLEMK
jgi:hypothetical protein